MSNVDALKALYVALGGDADDVAEVDQIAEMIVEISKIATAVPSAAEATDGQVLTVADGAWTVANLPD